MWCLLIIVIAQLVPVRLPDPDSDPDEAEDDMHTLNEYAEELHSQKLNLNTATVQELMRIPGISARQAESMIAWRRKHGRFRSLDGVKAVPGIGEAARTSLEPYVYVKGEKTAAWSVMVTARHEEQPTGIRVYRQAGLSGPGLSASMQEHIGQNRLQSGYIMIRDAALFHTLIAGDYRVSAGRGLVINQSGRTGRSPFGGHSPKRVLRANPGSSTHTQRGLAVETGTKTLRFFHFEAGNRIEYHLKDALMGITHAKNTGLDLYWTNGTHTLNTELAVNPAKKIAVIIENRYRSAEGYLLYARYRRYSYGYEAPHGQYVRRFGARPAGETGYTAGFSIKGMEGYADHARSLGLWINSHTTEIAVTVSAGRGRLRLRYRDGDDAPGLLQGSWLVELSEQRVYGIRAQARTGYAAKQPVSFSLTGDVWWVPRSGTLVRAGVTNFDAAVFELRQYQVEPDAGRRHGMTLLYGTGRRGWVYMQQRILKKGELSVKYGATHFEDRFGPDRAQPECIVQFRYRY